MEKIAARNRRALGEWECGGKRCSFKQSVVQGNFPMEICEDMRIQEMKET